MKFLNGTIKPPINILIATSFILSDGRKRAEEVVVEGGSSAHVGRSRAASEVPGVSFSHQFHPDLPTFHEAVSVER